MLINSYITIYHKILDEKTRLEKWEKYQYLGWWFGGKGSSTQKGYENANDVQVRIPYDVNAKGNILTGKLSINLSKDNLSEKDIDITKFEIGDIIAKGKIDDEIEFQSDLKGYKDVYNITAISNNTFGYNPHIHLGGK